MLFHFPAEAVTSNYGQCCICVTDDPSDKFDYRDLQKKDCNNWLHAESKKIGCEHSDTLFIKQVLSTHFLLPYTCSRVKVYTNFHGMSYDTNRPFEISERFSNVLNATEVCLDGATCSVFDRTNELGDYAKKLGKSNPNTNFKISGNQNAGGFNVTSNPIRRLLGSGVKEDPATTSKVSVEVQGEQVAIKFDFCSNAGDRCIWQTLWGRPLKVEGKKINDPNTKSCLYNGKLTEQSCCVKRTNDSWQNGKWSMPGQSCD